MTGVHNVLLDGVEVLLGGLDADLAKGQRQVHLAHELTQLGFLLLQAVEVQLAEQTDSHDLAVDSVGSLVGEVGAYAVIDDVSELGLTEALGGVGDNTGGDHVEEGNVAEGLGALALTVVGNSLLTVSVEHVVDVGSHVVGSVDVDGILVDMHLGTTVEHLDLLGHSVHDASGVVTDRARGDNVEVHVDSVDLVIEAPRGLLAALGGVHNAHAGEGSAGRGRGRDVDSAQPSGLASSLGKVHDLAAADTDDLLGAKGMSLLGQLVSSLVGAPTGPDLELVVDTSLLQCRLKLIFDGIPRTRAGNDEHLLAKASDLLAQLRKQALLATHTTGAKLDSGIQLGLIVAH